MHWTEKVNWVAWLTLVVMLISKLAGADFSWWLLAIPGIVAFGLSFMALIAALVFVILQEIFLGR